MNPELPPKKEVWHVCFMKCISFMWFLISILEEEVLWPLGAYNLTPKNWKIIKHLAQKTLLQPSLIIVNSASTPGKYS